MSDDQSGPEIIRRWGRRDFFKIAGAGALSLGLPPLIAEARVDIGDEQLKKRYAEGDAFLRTQAKELGSNVSVTLEELRAQYESIRPQYLSDRLAQAILGAYKGGEEARLVHRGTVRSEDYPTDWREDNKVNLFTLAARAFVDRGLKEKDRWSAGPNGCRG